MTKYGNIEYWNERYTNQNDSTFDWLENYCHVRDILICKVLKLDEQNEVFKKDYDPGSTLQEERKHWEDKRNVCHQFKILNVGCGNSPLPEDMYDTDGFVNITNTDLSKVCIEQMM